MDEVGACNRCHLIGVKCGVGRGRSEALSGRRHRIWRYRI